MLTNERDPSTFDLYRYAVKDYARTLVFQNDEAFEISAVSPDGRYAALVKPRTSADSDIYLLDTTGKEAPELITRHTGNVSHGVYEFTRDSKRLVYATDENGEFTEAWTYDIASGDKAPLISADWDVMFVSFSESGRYRVSATNEDARTVIRVLDSESGEEVALPGLPQGDLAQIRFSRDEKKVALMVSSDTSPNDVYVVDLDAGKSARLTQALNPKIDEAALVDAEVVRYKSFDGLEIPGILYRPKTASATARAPALVWVHGGPGGQSRTGYSATMQHLVNHGYAVLAANNRGSSGYGKTFFHMDDKRHGDVDLKDIVYGEELSRIARLGGRRTHRHHRRLLRRLHGRRGAGFRAGSLRRRRQYLRRHELGAHADQHPAVVGILQGGALRRNGRPGDRRRTAPQDLAAVPRQEHQGAVAGRARARTIRAYCRWKATRSSPPSARTSVPVEYVLFADEGHGFTKRENRIKASDAYVAFLDEYL